MESQTKKSKKPGTGDTVSITVSITQDNRKKLREMKGILAYSTLDKTINAAVDMVDMRTIFQIAMKDHGLSYQIDPTVENLDLPKVDTTGTIGLLTDEERKMIEFCKKTLIDLKADDMDTLLAMIGADVIIIRNTALPQISPAGEMTDDVDWNE